MLDGPQSLQVQLGHRERPLSANHGNCGEGAQPTRHARVRTRKKARGVGHEQGTASPVSGFVYLGLAWQDAQMRVEKLRSARLKSSKCAIWRNFSAKGAT